MICFIIFDIFISPIFIKRLAARPAFGGPLASQGAAEGTSGGWGSGISSTLIYFKKSQFLF